MFGIKKNKEQKELEKKKKKGMMDKLVMGAIIGGAIGSVVGLSVAPKSGKETREYIKEKSVAAKDKGVKIWEVLKKWWKK
jgi:gas vesicle protein